MQTSVDAQLLRALETLGHAVLRSFLALQRAHRQDVLAQVHHEVAADLIYAIDQEIEQRILAWLEAEWPREHPVDLVMEGLETPLRLPSTAPAEAAARTLIIDPLDGTREIMWDRRSAWFLAALAPTPVENHPTLQAVSAAVMVELPPTGRALAHVVSAQRGAAPRASLQSVADLDAPAREASLQPFPDESLAHGFISIGSPFFQGKARVSRFAEEFIARYFGQPLEGLPIFDDQYISSGGQLFDLMSGRLRLVGDLRPLFLENAPGRKPLTCHPYDVCTAMIAQALGCVVEQPDGSPLAAPLDTTSSVAFMAYANEHIAARARPIVRELLPLLQTSRD